MRAQEETRGPPGVGEVAPDFDLLTNEGPRIRLSEAVRQGPVVVAFFPGAFTSTCTQELCRFSREWDEYARLGTRVVGVSPDSRPVLRAYAKQEGIRVTLASDFERKTLQAYGIPWESSWGPTCQRAVFVVDASMRIRYAWVTDDADVEPPYDEVKAALRAFR